MKRKAEWQSLADEAAKHRDEAEKIRNLARSTDAAIESALLAAGYDAVVIVNGRLCALTDRGKEPISELSKGERYKLAFDIASKGLGQGALLGMIQEAWESLDPINQIEVATMAQERGITVVTGQCTRDKQIKPMVFKVENE